jgi:citrate synthase
MGRVDQRGFDNQHEWLGAQAAAALLGVKPATLYAYVSRGLVRRLRPAGERRLVYAREDLLRLRARHDARSGHAPVAAGALRFGEPVLESALTEITPEGPRYRGHPMQELQDAAFESVAELLFSGAPIGERPRWPAPLPLDAVETLVPRGTPPLHALGAIVPVLALSDRQRGAHPPAVELDGARALIRTMAAALGLGRDRRATRVALGAPTVAEAAARALGGDAARIERILVLAADHELNASTFTARVAASAGADLVACVTAALGTMSGPLHGAASDRAAALLAEIRTPARAANVVAARLRRGEGIPGFGHPLYPGGDPRGRLLLERTPSRLVDAVARASGLLPNLDAGLIAATADLPPGSAAGLFTLGRTAGWIAHALEQRTQGFLLRPRARYVGA